LSAAHISPGGEALVKLPMVATPVPPVLNPWAWAPTTAWVMPPARPSKTWP
jgi:hypothetical protein